MASPQREEQDEVVVGNTLHVEAPVPAASTTTSRVVRVLTVVAAVVAIVLDGAIGVTTFVSGLIMPGWAVALLVLVWVAGQFLMIRWRANPLLLLAVPVALWGLWFAVGWMGDTWLGWVA